MAAQSIHDSDLGSKQSNLGSKETSSEMTDLPPSVRHPMVLNLPSPTSDVKPSTTETTREALEKQDPLQTPVARGCGHPNHQRGMQLDGTCRVCQMFAKEVCRKSTIATAMTEENKHQCAQCGRSFKRRCKLTVHMLIHSDERPHGCEECGKRFKRKDKLVSHRRTHSNERPYTCTTCNKTFKRHDNLVAHQRRHEGNRRFWCPYCDKKFVISSEMRDHIKRVHPGMAVPSPAETVAHETYRQEGKVGIYLDIKFY